jgi:hypothetical protein
MAQQEELLQLRLELDRRLNLYHSIVVGYLGDSPKATRDRIEELERDARSAWDGYCGALSRAWYAELQHDQHDELEFEN